MNVGNLGNPCIGISLRIISDTLCLHGTVVTCCFLTQEKVGSNTLVFTNIFSKFC